MNKSKFLKKSLALLLALMLVFAMIPLSASAAGALPNLTRLYINSRPVTADGTTFQANIGETTDKISIQVDSTSLGTVDGQATMYVVKEDTVDTIPLTPGTPEDVDLSKWGTTSGNTVTLTLRVWSNDETDHRDYTVELTRTTDSRVARVEKVAKGKGTYNAYVVDGRDTNNIYMDVARNAMTNGANKAQLIVYPAENGKVTGSGTITDNNNGSYTIEVTADKQKFTVESQSAGSVKAEYTIYVTVHDALTSLSINDVAGVFSDKDGNGVDDTVTVTLPQEMARDELGYALTNVRLPMDFTFYGDDSSLNLDADKTGPKPAVEFVSGTNIDLGNLVNGDYEATLTLDVAGYPGLQSYDLVVTLEKSTDTALQWVQMNDQLVTEITGTDVDVHVPANTDLTAVDVILFTDPSVKSISGFEPAHKYGTSPAEYYGPDLTFNGYVVWVADDKVSGTAYTFNESTSKIENGTRNTFDMTKGLIVTVTSEAGTTEQYTLNAIPEENRTTAVLRSLILQSPDGTNYEGKIQDNNYVLFDTIPYMTTDVSSWKVFATANDAATVKFNKSAGYNTTIINGTTTASSLGLTTLNTQAEIQAGAAINETYIQVENMNDPSLKSEYHVVIQLPQPKAGKTLTSIDFHAVTADPDAYNNDQVYSWFNQSNLVKASVESGSKQTYNTGTITLNPAYSLSSENNETGAANIYNIVNSFATQTGGVAYLVDVNTQYVSNPQGSDARLSHAIPLNALVSNKNAYSSDGKQIVASQFTHKLQSSDYVILVLPEEVARKVNQGTVNPTYGLRVLPDQYAKGTVYTLAEDPAEPSHDGRLRTISVGTSNLTVGTDTISGQLAFSNTAAAQTDTTDAEYVNFNTSSPYAVFSVDGTASKLLLSGGDADGDGEPDTTPGAKNQKLIFVRNNDADKTVSVFAWDNTNTTQITSLTVLAEDRLSATSDANLSKTTYKLDLHWTEPNTEAEITSFTLAGSNGSITTDNENGVINVTVPYNTDVKGLVATFSTSLGATVKTVDGVDMISGKTSLNYSEPVELIVTSENTHNTKLFTVNVTVSDQFTDVNTSDWFYDEVMDAANRGWVDGVGEGRFSPQGNMKRGDFALIVARIMGYNEAEYTESVFPDVASDSYYSAAIAFCKDKGLIDGNDQGYFNPESSITREQMAKIICNARGLSEVTDPTNPYADDAQIAQWAKGYVYACQAEDIMSGDESVNRFTPKDNATRAEAAAVLVRAFA